MNLNLLATACRHSPKTCCHDSATVGNLGVEHVTAIRRFPRVKTPVACHTHRLTAFQTQLEDLDRTHIHHAVDPFAVSRPGLRVQTTFAEAPWRTTLGADHIEFRPTASPRSKCDTL